MVYDLAPKGRYTATVRALAGTEFVELVRAHGGHRECARVETTWTLVSSHNSARLPTIPYEPEHEIGDPAEPIDFAQMNTHIAVAPGIGKDGELPFRLGPYQPWPAFSVGTFANFWNARTGDALGVFIDKVERWDDGDYAIWHSSDRLAVRYFWKDGKFNLEMAARHRYAFHLPFPFTITRWDRKAVEDMARRHAGVTGKDGLRYVSALQPTSHMLFLAKSPWRRGFERSQGLGAGVSRHGGASPRRSFTRATFATPPPLERTGRQCRTDQRTGLVGHASERRLRPSAVAADRRFMDRRFHKPARAAVDCAAQRERVTAGILLMAYTHAGEDYMPMRPLLSGHPNFLSDVKSVPAMAGVPLSRASNGQDLVGSVPQVHGAEHALSHASGC